MFRTASRCDFLADNKVRNSDAAISVKVVADPVALLGRVVINGKDPRSVTIDMAVRGSARGRVVLIRVRVRVRVPHRFCD